MWCHNLLISCLLLSLFQKLLKPVPKRSALRQPQRQTLSNFLRKSKQLQLFPQFPMIPAFRLLKQFQIFCKIFLLRKRNPINTSQLLILLITAPVSPGNTHNLHCLDKPRIRNMSTTAQIRKSSMITKSNRPILQIRNQLSLILIIFLRIICQRLRLSRRTHRKLVLLPRDPQNLILYILKILIRQSMLPKIHIIIKPILNRRTNSQFNPRISLLQRLRQHMRSRMPKRLLPLLIIPGIQYQRTISRQWRRRLNNRPVKSRRNHIPCKPLTNILSNIHRTCAPFKLLNCPVRQTNLNHVSKFMNGKYSRLEKHIQFMGSVC